MNSSVPALELREHQAPCEPTLRQYWRENPGDYPLIVMPPGSGKTFTACSIIQSLNLQDPTLDVLWLAHREELITQAEQSMIRTQSPAEIGVYAASLGRREIKRNTFASRDSMQKGLNLYPDYKPRLVVVDEAHNIPINEETRYRRIIGSLKDRNPKLMVVGLTATPYRENNRLLYGDDPTDLFKSIAYQVKMRPLIEKGLLLPLIVPDVDERGVIDTSHIPIANGKFHERLLREASELHHLVRIAVDEWWRLAHQKGRQSTLVYCISIKHAEQTLERFQAYGVSASIVHSKLSDAHRKESVRDFLSRKLRVLINVGVFTEGTDFPCCDCILNLRAIQSLNLYVQIFGRGTRLFEGKENCLCLDFGECVDRFGPIDEAMPPERRKKGGAIVPRTKICPECMMRVSFYVSKCPTPGCEKTWKADESKKCKKCGCECSLSAKVCPACDNLFLNHESQASTKSLMGRQNTVRTFDVQDVRGVRGKSGRTGNWYIKVVYDTEALDHEFAQQLHFDSDRSKRIAEARWRHCTHSHVPTPRSVDQAMQIIQENGNDKTFKAVTKIEVDMKGKYKDIKRIHYD